VQELVLSTNIGTTIGDLERRDGRYFALFYQIRQLWGPVTSNICLKIDPYCLRQKCSPKNL